MSLTFYFAPMSTATLTEAVLAELGIACERVQLDIGAGDTRAAAFLAINPNGRVPVIVHEGVAIWESAAITMYLGETFGVEYGLYPAPGPRRGEAMKWIVWTNATLGEAIARLAAALPPGSAGAVEPGSRDWVDPPDRSKAAGAKAHADVAGCVAILDGALAGRGFLLDAYTLADTHLHILVGLVTEMGVTLEPYPHVAGWLARCAGRPALAGLEPA